MHRAWIIQSISKRILTALICFMALLLGQALAANAEDGNVATSTLGLKLYGYVEASYTQNFKNPSTGVNQLRIFDGDSNSFRPHMAQIVFEKEGKSGGQMDDRGGFRIKLDFGEDAKFTGGNTGADEVDFQEAYVQYVAPVGNGLDLRMGRMNTLIGYEVIESPFNPNFSRSWLFGLGEPFTTTGIRGSYEFNDAVSFAIGGINSFTGAQADTNSGKSVEALLSITPMEQVGVSLFGFWGPEGARGADNADRVMVGGILDVQATDQLELVVEAYYGNQANAFPSGANARWNGVAGYVIYDFNDKWGARFRAEIFEDAAGSFSCGGALGTFGNANVCFGSTPATTVPSGAAAGATIPAAPGPAVAQTLWEMTYTLQYKPIPSVITRLEFRYDKSDQNTFQDGVRAANNQQTLSFSTIYLF